MFLDRKLATTQAIAINPNLTDMLIPSLLLDHYGVG